MQEMAVVGVGQEGETMKGRIRARMAHRICGELTESFRLNLVLRVKVLRTSGSIDPDHRSFETLLAALECCCSPLGANRLLQEASQLLPSA